MIRLFIRNLFRSLFVDVIVYAISAVITLIVAVVGDLVFNDLLGLFEVLTLPVTMIMIAVVSFFVSWFIVFVMTDGTPYICFSYDEFHCGKAMPHIAHLFFHMLLLFVLVAGGLSLFGWLKWDWLKGFLNQNEWYLFMLLVFPSVCVSQFMYFAVGFGYYKGIKCSKCKHVFCIKEKSTQGEAWDTYGYTDRTRNESIGSIGSIDVRADVTRRQYHRRRHSTALVNGHCVLCKNEYSYTRHSSYKEKL